MSKTIILSGMKETHNQTYDNSNSTLQANTAGGAIDELDDKVNAVNTSLTKQEILSTISGSGILDSDRIDYREYCIAVKWGQNGVYTNFVTIPRILWYANTEDPLRINLNNKQEAPYIEVTWRGLSSDSVWCTVNASNSNICTSLIGIG